MSELESSQIDKKQRNKQILWGRIKDAQIARLVVQETVKGFYLLAALQAILGLILSLYHEAGFGLIIDGAIFAVLAWLMQKFMSRIAAMVLLLISTLALLSTFLNFLGQDMGGGTNIILAGLMFYLAARSMQAVWIYNRQK